MTDNIFEKASKVKLRFTLTGGNLTVEDLWDIPLQSSNNKINLDDMWKILNKQAQQSSGESLIETATPKNTILQLSIDIMRHVIETKLEKDRIASLAAETKQKKQKLMELIAGKEDDKLSSLSLPKLKKMLDEL